MKLISISVKKNIEVKKSYTKSCPSLCQGLELRAVADMQFLKRDEQLKPLTVQSLRFGGSEIFRKGCKSSPPLLMLKCLRDGRP